MAKSEPSTDEHKDAKETNAPPVLQKLRLGVVATFNLSVALNRLRLKRPIRWSSVFIYLIRILDRLKVKRNPSFGP